MVKCTICGKYCKNLAGLSGHIQFKHPGYKLQPTTTSKRQKINQETHLPHQKSYQHPQETYPPYQGRIQNIPADDNPQYNPYVQRRQGMPPRPSTLIQKIQEYKEIFNLIDDLTHRDKEVPDPEIERLNREMKSLKLPKEKTNSTKESPVKDTIVDIGPLDWIRSEQNIEIKNIIKKAQDNDRDPPSSFLTPSDNKFLAEKEREKEKINKALESYYNTKLKLKRYEYEAEHGDPVVDALLVGGLKMIQQIGEALGNKPKKQEINPSPKRVNLIPSPERVNLIPFEEN